MAHRASGALSPQLEPRTDPIRSTGDAVEQVWAEHSVSSDLVVRYRARLFRTELSVFSNTIDDNIEKQALILPAGAVGLLLAGNLSCSRLPAAPFSWPPRRTQCSCARIWRRSRAGLRGHARVESVPHARIRNGRHVAAGARALDGCPAERRGYVTVRYVAPGTRWWVEPYVHAAARQARLSSLDLEDRRTGATRSRSSISSFFLNGATARGW